MTSKAAIEKALSDLSKDLTNCNRRNYCNESFSKLEAVVWELWNRKQEMKVALLTAPYRGGKFK